MQIETGRPQAGWARTSSSPCTTHPHPHLIGIRDIDCQLLFDVEGPLAMDLLNKAPFFPLMEQLESLLLRQDVFPKLQFVRDLSRESNGIRKGRC
jgi:hypothetical protein